MQSNTMHTKPTKSVSATPVIAPPPETAFSLEIQGMGGSRRWDNVVAFAGEDMTDHIALKSGGERLMAVVGFGLARARHADGTVTYFAFPHALLYFTGDSLSINARHYVATADRAHLLADFEGKLDDFEAVSPEIRSRLHRLGEEMLARLDA
jgi:hypothetical protein